MSKNIHPGVLVVIGILLHSMFYLLGGVVGAIISVAGDILFLCGVVGLIILFFRSSNETDQNAELNNNLTTIYDANLPVSEALSRAHAAIERTNLSIAEKQNFYNNFKDSLQDNSSAS
jgi:uncharacterized membrane protein YeiB